MNDSIVMKLLKKLNMLWYKAGDENYSGKYEIFSKKNCDSYIHFFL